jgi:hypothetical protein
MTKRTRTALWPRIGMTLLALAAPAVFGQVLPGLHMDRATAQSMPVPMANCSPFGGRVPAGQANPSDEPEPMGPVWCFPLGNAPTTRLSGANDWVDHFNTNISMTHLNDHEMGYRVIEVFNTTPGFLKSGSFINNNHWMIDLANTTQYRLSGGVMLSPDRSFRAENGKLVVEFDVAASSDAMGGSNQFAEFDLTSAPDITNATVDTLYGYGAFGGVGAVGCRLESGANFVCAMYDSSTRATDGRDVLGGPGGQSGRVWETQGAGNRRTATSVVGGTPEFVVAPGLRLRDVWRACKSNQMDMFCRDRFRFEFTKTSIHIFVNGYPAMLIDGLLASNPDGRDSRIPDSFLSDARVYFTSWVNGGRDQPLTRWHWGRIAVNPRNTDGSVMAPSAAPSFCLGQHQNTCPIDMQNMPTTLSSPGMPAMPPMPSTPDMPIVPSAPDLPDASDGNEMPGVPVMPDHAMGHDEP